MPLQLFWSPISQPSRVVYWYLVSNDIPFEAVRTTFADMRKPDYEVINPCRTVPAIKDEDGTCVFESNAILFYLREKYGDKAGLYPTSGDLIQRTKVQQLLSWYPIGLRAPLVGYIFPVLAAPRFFNAAPPSEEVTKELLGKLKVAVQTANDVWLTKPGFVAGTERATVADLQLISELEQVRFLGPGFDWAAYPNVVRYRELMAKVPHHAEVFAPLIAATSGDKP